MEFMGSECNNEINLKSIWKEVYSLSLLKRVFCCFIMICLLLNLSSLNLSTSPVYSSNMSNVAFAEEFGPENEGASDKTIIELVSIETSLEDITLEEGESINVDIFAVYSDGIKSNVTNQVSWKVEKENKDVVEVSGGEIHAISIGKTIVVVSFKNQELEINVNIVAKKAMEDEFSEELEISRILVTPSNFELTEGETGLPFVQAVFEDNSKQDISGYVTWIPEDQQIVEVVDQEIKALQVGTTIIKGNYKEHEVKLTVAVTPSKSDETIVNQPEEQSGDQQQIASKNVTAANDFSVTLFKGESYKFSNFHTSASYVKSNATGSNTYDYAIYLADGSALDFDVDSKSTSRGVRSGGSMIVTVTSSNPVTFTVPTNHFFYEESILPALLKRTISIGETISLINISDINHSLTVTGNSKEYSYQSYKSDGTLSAEVFDSSANTLTIPSDGKVTVTATSTEPVTIAGYHDFIQEAHADQALNFATLEKNESYIFVNNSNTSQKIKTNGSSSSSSKKTYDSAIYNADGSPQAQDSDSTAVTKTIPAGGKIVVTTTSDLPVTFKGFTSYFNGTTSDSPALFKKTVRKDETLQVINTLSESVTMLVNGTSIRRYSYQLLNSDGSIYLQSYDSYKTALAVPAGGKLIATTITDEAVTFKGYYDIFSEYIPPEFLITRTLEKGQSYAFINNSSSNQKIDTDGTLSSTERRTFDYAIYSGGGTPYSQSKDSGTSYRIVPAGGKIIVTVTSDLPVTFRAFESVFTGEETEKPALFREYVSKNQALAITNIGNKTADILVSSPGKFSYQMILNGNVTSANHDVSFTSRGIPGMTTFLATVTSDEPVLFSGYAEVFGIEMKDSPSIHRIELGMSESYTFINKTNKDQNIRITSEGTKSFDYAIYNQDGSGNAQDINVVGTSRSVPPSGKMVITNTSSDPLVLSAFVTDFNGMNRTEQAIVKETVLKSQTTKFKNNSPYVTQLRRVDVNSVIERFNYTIFNKEGNIVSQELNSSVTSLNLPENGWVELSVISDEPVTFFGYYDHFASNGGGNEPQFVPLEVNSFTDVSENTNEAAYFKVTPLQSGIHRMYTSSYLNNGSSNDTQLHIYTDANLQNEIASNDDHEGPYGSLFSKVEWTAIAGTTYYIKLTATNNLQARLSVEEDLDSTMESAFPAEWDEIYSDRLSSPYDLDYYKLTITEPAQIHLYVTSNAISLLDGSGEQIQTFYPNEPETVFYADEPGTYYAKVWYNAPSSMRSIAPMAVPDIGDYTTTPKEMKLDPSYAVIDSTPGFKKSATFKWTFNSSHEITKIQVYSLLTENQIGDLVYEQTRTNLSAGVQYTFTWDGSVFADYGSFAPSGRYKVKVVTTDFPQWPIFADVVVKNTVDTEEYELGQLLDRLNQETSSEKIKRMQTYLSDMLFYKGEITGQYDVEFLLSVITYETVINKWSTRVARDVYRYNLPYLPEDGTISDRLLIYAEHDYAFNRDMVGSFYDILYTGDIIILSEGVGLGVGATVKAVEIYVNGGKVVKNVITYIKGERVLLLPASKVRETIDKIDSNTIHHIINGSKNSNHRWDNLVPNKNWDVIKEIIADVMENGAEQPYKKVFQKSKLYGNNLVEVIYQKFDDGSFRISNAWVK